jgi:hypothetical protein
VDAPLMDEVKRFVYGHYEEHLEAKFYASALAMDLEAATRGDTDEKPSDEVDWESTYFIQHHPKTNVADFPEITPPTRSVYILLCCLQFVDSTSISCCQLPHTHTPCMLRTRYHSSSSCNAQRDAGRVRRPDGVPRGASGRVHEPQPGPPRRPRGRHLRAAVRGHQVRHVPVLPAPGAGVGPARAHRRRRHHPAPPGRRRGRPRVPQGRRPLGPRRPHQGGQALRQHRGPDRGPQRRRLPERPAPRRGRGPGPPPVRGHVLQPWHRRRGRAGAPQGSGRRRRRVPRSLQVRGLSRLLPGHQVRRQGRQVPGRQEAARLSDQLQVGRGSLPRGLCIVSSLLLASRSIHCLHA